MSAPDLLAPPVYVVGYDLDGRWYEDEYPERSTAYEVFDGMSGSRCDYVCLTVREDGEEFELDQWERGL